MNQDVNVENEASPSNKRVFKFHNVNQEKIFGIRRTKKEENKKNILISRMSVEDEYKKKKTQLIMEQFVPIKQKSLENKAFPASLQGISARNEEDRQESDRSGLRLVNIASLQEPSDKSQNISFPQIPNIPCKIQESPLDLTRKQSGRSDGPLDLSTKSHGSNTIGNTRENDQHSQQQLSNQPLQFLLLKNVSSTSTNGVFIPSNALPVVSNTDKDEANETKKEFSKQEAEEEISECKKLKKLTSSPQQAPIQVVLTDGRVVHVLPRKAFKEQKISEMEQRKVSAPVELKKDHNQNEMKPPVKKMTGSGGGGPDLMVKTNETVTKNGDLFCTFKNVKHMKMLKEQQLRKSNKKSKKS